MADASAESSGIKVGIALGIAVFTYTGNFTSPSGLHRRLLPVLPVPATPSVRGAGSGVLFAALHLGGW